MNQTPRTYFAYIAILFVSYCGACQPKSQRVEQRESQFFIPESRPLQTAPLLDVPIESDSQHAAIQYIILFEQAMDAGYNRRIQMEFDHDSFRAHNWDEETDATQELSAWLTANQDLTESILHATTLESFLPASEYVFYKNFTENDPRRLYRKGLRDFAMLLQADCVHRWFQGDHTGSLDRADAMMRIALQLRSYQNLEFSEAIFALSIAGYSLELYKWLLGNPRCTQQDRNRIQESLSQISGNDPFLTDQTIGIIILSHDQWISKQTQMEEESEELWHMIGMIHGVTIFVGGMFDQALAGEEHAPDIERITEELLIELDGLEYKDLESAYKRFHPFAIEIGNALVDGTATLDRLKEISKQCEDDKTGIADLLMFSTARIAHRRTVDIVQRRDQLIRLLDE